MNQLTSDIQKNGATARKGAGGIAPEAVRAQLERILANPLFRYSHRSINLLTYIVENTLKGQLDNLKERIIGIEVFGRTPDYDTSNDSTVRVVANEVRKRLTEYYSKSEHAEELVIEVPVRSYIAEFQTPLRSKPDEPAEAQPYKLRFLFKLLGTRMARIAFGGVAVVLLLWLGLYLMWPAPVIDRFWQPLVKSSSAVLICIGSPVENKASDPATIPPQAGVPFYDFEERVYVRMMDANAADSLARYLKHYGKDSVVRPTQGSQLPDLDSAPLIVYGMALNEWAVKLGSNFRFQLRKDTESGHGVRWIEDSTQPANRTWAVDLSAPYQQVSTDYALISRVRDATTGHWWIGIAGLTGAGAQAASHLLMDANAMNTVGAMLPRNWEKKNLQIVLQTRMAQGRPGSTQVVTAYSW